MSVVQVLVAASYPFLVYGGLTVTRPRILVLLLAATALLCGTPSPGRWSAGRAVGLVLPIGLTATVLVVAGVLHDDRVLRLAPALTNAGLLIGFGWTLWHGPSVAEIVARMRGPVPDVALPYCRVVTGIWCLFFVLNGGIALWLAVYGSLAQWTLYTGFITYVLTGALFLTEAAYRWRRFPRLRGATAVGSTS